MSKEVTITLVKKQKKSGEYFYVKDTIDLKKLVEIFGENAVLQIYTDDLKQYISDSPEEVKLSVQIPRKVKDNIETLWINDNRQVTSLAMWRNSSSSQFKLSDILRIGDSAAVFLKTKTIKEQKEGKTYPSHQITFAKPKPFNPGNKNNGSQQQGEEQGHGSDFDRPDIGEEPLAL